jgi:hypothetical protein
MAQQGRNERCPCGSGRKVKHCCGIRRGPSEVELAKAWLQQQARSAALVLAARSDAEVVALLDAATLLPRQDVSMQLPLPRLLSPALERLRATIAEDDPGEVEVAVPAALAEVQQRLLGFQRRYEQTAVPFDWRFTRADLDDLLRRLDEKHQLTEAA